MALFDIILYLYSSLAGHFIDDELQGKGVYKHEDGRKTGNTDVNQVLNIMSLCS